MMTFTGDYICFEIDLMTGDEWWGSGGYELWRSFTGGGCKCAFCSNAQASIFVTRAREIPGWEDTPFTIKQSDDRNRFANKGRWIPGVRDLPRIRKETVK